MSVLGLVMLGSNDDTTLCQRRALNVGINAAASIDNAANPHLQVLNALIKSAHLTFLNAKYSRTAARAMGIAYLRNFFITLWYRFWPV